jgi:hypothetical protein
MFVDDGSIELFMSLLVAAQFLLFLSFSLLTSSIC